MIGLSDLMLSNHGTLRGDPASTSGMWGIYASHNEGQSTSFDSSDWMEYQEPKAYLESLKRKQAVVEARDHAGQTPYYDGPQRQLKSVTQICGRFEYHGRLAVGLAVDYHHRCCTNSAWSNQ